MSKCKFCGEKVNEDERYCPACGEKLEGGGIPEDTGMKEYDREDAASCKTTDESCDTHPRRRVKAVVIGAVALLLVAALVVSLVATGVLGGTGGGANAVVAKMGEEKLTNGQLAYYYWGELYYLEDYYAQYGVSVSEMIDIDKPLDEQEFVGTEWPTWHDYFYEMAVDNWANTIAIYKEAVSAGHQMDAERAENLDGLGAWLEEESAAAGFDTIDEMIKADYGKFADYEGYREYLEYQYLAYSYVNEFYGGLIEKYSADVGMVPSVNVRHILLSFESNGDAAKEMAEAVYADWQTVGTEDYFAQLATEKTNDPGSANTGGMYENVAPGDMVVPFDDWCFDEARKVGDHGIVETTYGFHIMYYCGAGEDVQDSTGQHAAESAAQAEYDEWIAALLAKLGERELSSEKVNVGK